MRRPLIRQSPSERALRELQRRYLGIERAPMTRYVVEDPPPSPSKKRPERQEAIGVPQLVGRRRRTTSVDVFTWRLFLITQDFTDETTTIALEYVDGEWQEVGTVAAPGALDQAGIQWLFQRNDLLAIVGEAATADNYISDDGGATWAFIGEGNGWTAGASVLFARNGRTWRLNVDGTEANTDGSFGFSDELGGAFQASYTLDPSGGDWWLIGTDSGYAAMHPKFDQRIALPYGRFAHAPGQPATQKVAVTVDGGETWITTDLETGTYSGGSGGAAVWLPNNTIVVALTFDATQFRIYESTDSGATWALDTTLDAGFGNGNQPFLINAGNTLFVFSRAGTKFFRKLVGSSWEEFATPTDGDVSFVTQMGLNSVAVCDSFGAGQGKVYLLEDAGAATPAFTEITPAFANENIFIITMGRGQPRVRTQ